MAIFFFKINQRGRSFLKTSSLPFSRCKSLASRFLTGRIGAPMLSYERSWLYPSSKKKTSGRSSSASSKQQTPHLFASSPTMYRAPGSKATPGRHPLGQSLCSRSGPTMTWKVGITVCTPEPRVRVSYPCIYSSTCSTKKPN